MTMGASCAPGEFERVNRKCSHILQNGEHTFGRHFGFSSAKTTRMYFCQSSKTVILLVKIFVLGLTQPKCAELKIQNMVATNFGKHC